MELELQAIHNFQRKYSNISRYSNYQTYYVNTSYIDILFLEENTHLEIRRNVHNFNKIISRFEFNNSILAKINYLKDISEAAMQIVKKRKKRCSDLYFNLLMKAEFCILPNEIKFMIIEYLVEENTNRL